MQKPNRKLLIIIKYKLPLKKFFLFFKPLEMFLISHFEYFNRASACYCVFWNAPRNNATCLYDCALANIYATQYDDPVAKPDKIFDNDVFENVSFIVWQHSSHIIMVCCDDQATFTGVKMIPNFYFAVTFYCHSVKA